METGNNKLPTVDEAILNMTRPEGPYGFIQWKGTEVCMDCWCSCGTHFHMDAEFMYAVECPSCHRTFAVYCYVKFIEVDDPDNDRILLDPNWEEE